MSCGCCGAIVPSPRDVRFGRLYCDYREQFVCRTCNQCEQHCRCAPQAQILDVPFEEQLSIAIDEWAMLGVPIRMSGTVP
jgi:hypothetical protein